MEPTIVFESRDLRARLVPGGGRALLFVTFSSYFKDRTLDRPGFGEDFLADQRIDAVHIVSRTNRFFQYPELPDMIAAIRRVAAGYDRVIAYGSSMGGFGALTHGADCGATIAIALSPQVSLSPKVAPFETRWRSEARAIRRWQPPARRPELQLIAYDPRHAIDRAHFDALARLAPTIGLRVPYAGHPVGAALSQADLLKPLVRDVIAGTFSAATYERLLRERRRGSGQYLYTLSRRLGAHHVAAKRSLAEQALALDPSPHNHCNVAERLAAVGRHEKAEAQFGQALAAGPGDVDTLTAFAAFLERRGDLAGASRLVCQALARNPDPRLRLRLWRLRLARLGIRAPLF